MKIRSSCIKRNIKSYIFHYIICALFLGLPAAFAKEAVVNIHGVPQDIEENIRENLSVLSDRNNDDAISGKIYHSDPNRVEDSDGEDFDIDQAEQEILRAIEPFGYYSPAITLRQLETEKNRIFEVDIVLNDPVIVQSIQLSILDNEGMPINTEHFSDLIALKTGDIFCHYLYEQSKKALLAEVIQQGYLNAMYTIHRVEVNVEALTADICLSLTLGPQFTFGEVTFGPTKICESLLERYLPFQTGEVYNPEKILLLQNWLYQSDYFKTIAVIPQIPDDSNITAIPVTIDLADAKPNQYMVGAGYGTDTGFRAKVGWNRRYVNSLGHRIHAEAQISQVYQRLEADYIIPGRYPATDFIKIKGGFFEEEYTEQFSRVRELGVLQEREINRWKRQLSLSYVQESYPAFSNNDTLVSHLILPEITFIQTIRNDPAAPTHGRRIELTLRGSADALSSDTTFIQAYMQIRWLHRFDDTIKGLLRTEAGFTFPQNSEKLPLSRRFYAGGDLSLRGYGYRMLPEEINPIGVRLPPGAPYLGIISAELSKTIRKPFAVFTFIDAGNAYRQIAVNQTVVGTGVGVEYHTRLGPIKFAIAKPLMKQSDSWRIHASVGPEL